MAIFSALFSCLVGVLWYILNSSGDIKFVPLGREICFIVCMLSVMGLCSSLRDSLGLKWGNSAAVFHSFSNSVWCRWKFVSMLLRWTSLFVFIRIMFVWLGI